MQAKQLDEYLASQGRSDTSFAEDTLFDLPPNLIDARDNLINVTQTLNRLALGPVGLLLDIMWSVRVSLCISSGREPESLFPSHFLNI